METPKNIDNIKALIGRIDQEEDITYYNLVQKIEPLLVSKSIKRCSINYTYFDERFGSYENLQ